MVTTYFPAGQYAVGCFVKSADGALHVVKGMIGSFDVIAARDTGVAPTVDGVVTLTDSRIRVQGAALTSGVHTPRVVSSNPHPQDFQSLRLLSRDTRSGTRSGGSHIGRRSHLSQKPWEV